jgi:hypothetical protein
LPGIGTFTLDPAVVIPGESERGGHSLATGISFKNALIQVPDDALISFIKEHTGKMKPLAAADLDFYLTTGKQLLNIGKPFYLEGIGTLLQNKEGKLDFSPGEYMIAKLDEPGTGSRHKADMRTDYDEPPREQEPAGNSMRQTLLLVSIIAGLIVICWGGYYLYKKNTYVEPAAENQATILPDSAPAHDTTTASTQTGNRPAGDTGMSRRTDSPSATVTPTKPAVTPAPTSTMPADVSAPAPGSSQYRFVILETENKNRALRRYNQLLGYQLNIKMDQKDSAFFKLYFPISARIRDTTHIKDSLADVYAAHVRIEK